MQTKRLICLLSVLALAATLLSGCATGAGNQQGEITYIEPYTTQNDPYGYSYDTVAQKDGLTLAINPDTTDISVTVDATGYTWSTANVREGDTNFYPVLYMDYASDDGNTGAVDSTNHSVGKGQYVIKPVENGVRVDYTLGEVAVDYIYPTSLTPERYNYWYEKGNDDQKAVIALTYVLKDISFYDDVTQAEMKEKFPHAVDGLIYDLRRATMTEAEKNEISRVMGELGYTVEDLVTDHTEYVPNTAPSAAFNVSVYYTLEDGGLRVRIPAESIVYDKSFHVQYVTLLQNFTGGAQKDGYFLLPDGSGSLMYFANGKENYTDYRAPVYGSEKTLFAANKIQNLKNASLPVYGSVEGENGYFVTVEQGTALSSINAMPGADALTARAWVDYCVEVRDYDFLANTNMTFEDIKLSVYQKERYAGDYQQFYRFLSGADANYSRMAAICRETLFGSETPVATAADYPLSAELVGTVDVQKMLFGIESGEAAVLTDFAGMQTIAEDLKGAGVTALDVRLSGWFGNGYRHGLTAGKLQPLSAMGGKEGLRGTVEALKKQGIGVSLEADPQYAYTGAGSVSGSLIGRMINQSNALLYSYNVDTFAQNKLAKGWHVLTPAETVKGLLALADTARELKADGVALRQLGVDLNADHNEDAPVSREASMAQLQEALATAAQKGKVTVTGANAYVLPYAHRIVDLPVVSNRQDQTDVSVPFLAMVVSGHTEYVGAPLNLSNRSRVQLLQMIESAAGAAALFTEKSCADLNAGDHTNLYASCYQEQKERVLEAYGYLQGALSEVYGQTIVSHEIPEKGVAKITATSGHWVAVNYNGYEVTVDGVKIAPLDYAKGGN